MKPLNTKSIKKVVVTDTGPYWTFKPTKEELEEYRRHREYRAALDDYAISFLQAKTEAMMAEIEDGKH